MVNLSQAYEPVMIKGLTVHKDNPFLFDFIVDVGQDKMTGEPLKKEGEKLIKYFLASLAIPEKDLWVNLSPYEKDKTIPEALGQTDMGRDLLTQDYILKQITASLIYPEKQLGKTFWDKVYAKAQQMYGTTQVPVNTFNKVWIMADRAEVFEHNQTAFVVDSHLKVMLEADYLAASKHDVNGQMVNGQKQNTTNTTTINNSPLTINHDLSQQIIREVILPELEKEVNSGKNFANLRQIFNSIILSSWYKKNLKQALLNQAYADKSKINGIKSNDQRLNPQDAGLTPTNIYEQYLKAYKKGVFNYIKEDIDASKGQMIPRKYFSGGFREGEAAAPAMTTNPQRLDFAMRSVTGLLKLETGFDINHARPAIGGSNSAMITGEQILTSPQILTAGTLVRLVYQEEERLGGKTFNVPGTYQRLSLTPKGIFVEVDGQEKFFYIGDNKDGPQVLGVEVIKEVKYQQKWQQPFGSPVWTVISTPEGIVMGTENGIGLWQPVRPAIGGASPALTAGKGGKSSVG